MSIMKNNIGKYKQEARFGIDKNKESKYSRKKEYEG